MMVFSGSSHSIQPEDFWGCRVDSPFIEVSQDLFTSSLHTTLMFLIIVCLTGDVRGILGIGKTRYPLYHSSLTLETLQYFLCFGFDVEPGGVFILDPL